MKLKWDRQEERDIYLWSQMKNTEQFRKKKKKTANISRTSSVHLFNMWMSGLLFVLLGMDVCFSNSGSPGSNSQSTTRGTTVNSPSTPSTRGTNVNSQSSPSTPGTNVNSQSSPSTQDNLALRGQAIQSSTYRVAANAIDSLPYTCIRTLQSDNPWWRVDLLHSYIISRVVITNRKDCCGGRLSGAEIHIGNSLENDGNNNPRCAVLNDIPLGQSLSVSCDNMEGQYVNLIIPGSSKVLSICEVEVYEKDLRKTFVMMQFVSSVNMTDPAVSNTILNQDSQILH
ncbi:uncharacterized protein [Paramisgurnus dabryanus]|uniref:uncharacterized protein isoform X2 n=1 Tax=Paramisgurnus dabryanus TaxID=90735 RepID=UPI003CCF004E